ncbi:nickel-dependent hydrogenase large subunit [Kosmotoga sp.]|uniref:hydrogenase large subunit n=1 Tax=Kosmotoga sp. TaxID=1955248 RepID=UPI0024AB05E3|nr:nickel-dependent hydrogenase large subunit [Kosmotoga sp.]MDI3523663.1 rane-bound hydrogenase subunit alpha [Kosmotoga sp.]MDK2953788.1 rane-bound hydrogenase subunit alpha [Kosmotoga sp.]
MSKEFNLPVGPFHPLLEEAEYFKIKLDGERVVDIEMETGWMHRGIEKISEESTFDQSIFVVERICGICSASHPFACINAFEDIGEIEVPLKARYIRSLIGELERVHSHLLWLGLAGHFIGYDTLWMWAWKYREPVLEVIEMITGNRNHYGMFKIGGVRRDYDVSLNSAVHEKLDFLEKKLTMVAKAVANDPVVRSRLCGVGVLTKEEAISYCAVGPTARASGVAIDVRKDEPYAAYDLLDFGVVVREEGDIFAKTVVRILEVFESIKMIRQIIEKLRKVKGPIYNDVKEIPAGEGIGRHEAPRGEVFHYIRTDGSNRPVRHKIRAPSYVNIPTYKASCVGENLADVLITLASVDPCYCCTERSVRLQTEKGMEITGNLLKLSQDKTDRLIKNMGEYELWKSL